MRLPVPPRQPARRARHHRRLSRQRCPPAAPGPRSHPRQGTDRRATGNGFRTLRRSWGGRAMTPDKLEALRRLALDERTPEEEARTAALLYVRAKPQTEPHAPTPTHGVLLTDSAAKIIADGITFVRQLLATPRVSRWHLSTCRAISFGPSWRNQPRRSHFRGLSPSTASCERNRRCASSRRDPHRILF